MADVIFLVGVNIYLLYLVKICVCDRCNSTLEDDWSIIMSD